jgi:UDP-N-acetylglucosamine transferase subunit ALG13
VIFVTVGTQFFDELIDEVDRLAAKGVFPEPVLAQIGLNRRPPRYINYVDFVDDLTAHCRDADLIITHAGTGSLCECIALGKPFIAVVNETKAGNHQLEFLEHLSSLYDFCWIPSPRQLAAALPLARPATPKGPPGLARLADDLRTFCHTETHQSPERKRRISHTTAPN